MPIKTHEQIEDFFEKNNGLEYVAFNKKFCDNKVFLPCVKYYHFPIAKAPMILIVNASDTNAENAIMAKVGEFVKHSTVKSRNLTSSSLDMTIECRTDNGDELVKAIMAIDGVISASLLSHDGEVTF